MANDYRVFTIFLSVNGRYRHCIAIKTKYRRFVLFDNKGFVCALGYSPLFNPYTEASEDVYKNIYENYGKYIVELLKNTDCVFYDFENHSNIPVSELFGRYAYDKMFTIALSVRNGETKMYNKGNKVLIRRLVGDGTYRTIKNSIYM